VVSFTGDTATSRGAASLLSAIGLGKLVADSPARYVEMIAALAADPGELGRLRAGMRRRMSGSPLMDELGFVKNLEKMYRAMWRLWCDEHPA
jgi:predicted O-linked N-acetylglucosamine transferase (SPINDLY family)